MVILDLQHHMYQSWIHPELQTKNRSRLYKKKGGQHLKKLNPWKILLHLEILGYIKILSYEGYIIKLEHGIFMLDPKINIKREKNLKYNLKQKPKEMISEKKLKIMQ